MCTELADELAKLVEVYARMHEVSSGDSAVDEGYNEAFDIVLIDLRSLLDDVKQAAEGRPNVPIGFKLHAVKH